MKHLIVLLFVAAFICTTFSVPAHAEDGKLNLNAATVEELANVPGLDQEMAEKIVELRTENGEFIDLDELLDVDGMDSSLLRKIKPYVFIEAVAGCNC